MVSAAEGSFIIPSEHYLAHRPTTASSRVTSPSALLTSGGRSHPQTLIRHKLKPQSPQLAFQGVLPSFTRCQGPSSAQRSWLTVTGRVRSSPPPVMDMGERKGGERTWTNDGILKARRSIGSARAITNGSLECYSVNPAVGDVSAKSDGLSTERGLVVNS